MKKFFLAVLSLALVLSLACCACLAEDAVDSTEEDLHQRIATPILAPEHFTLPAPQDLATLFPDDAIETYTNGGISISYPSSFAFEGAWMAGATSICYFTITDDAGNSLSLYWTSDAAEPAFSEDYVALVAQKLVDELTRDESEVAQILEIADNGEYYLQHYSAQAAEFGGLSGAETLSNYANFDSQAVQVRMFTGRWPCGVKLRLRLPMEGYGYYEVEVAIPDTDDREAITSCVALSSVLNTLKWQWNSAE